MRAARLLGLAAAAAVAALAGGPSAAGDADGTLTVVARKRTAVKVEKDVARPDGTVAKVVEIRTVPSEFRRTIDPKKTAIVVCDMWDDHWCKAAAKRCGELAKQAEPVLKAAREKGATIVHAPSDCMKFYEDHPARKRILAVPKADPPKAKDLPDPPLPVDDSDGGCDDVPPAKFSKAWTRQHAAITIDPDKDYVSDNGREVYGLMREKGLTTLVVMGVHTNMCVLNRTFAIKQMTRWGVDVLLVRDLTDAMYNPKMKPFVAHEKGTELIVEHIETHWCPTITGKALAGGK
ncbi:MAG: Isochorismatase family protein [Gemmataceae bacterium]|nr:Isochorismatase family protein [Gemmataceae bacterium]